MNRRIFIGVDGGGTRTTAWAFDQNGCLLGSSVGSGINYNSIGMENARTILAGVVNTLLDSVGETRCELISVGMSALDGAASQQLTLDFCGTLLPAEITVLHSDVYMALYGFVQEDPGILLISGTGMMAVANNREGQMLVSGGWGYLLADEGSGFYVGQEGIRAALNGIEGIGPETALSQALLDTYGVEDPRNVIDQIYSCDAPNRKIASFAPQVLAAARAKDAQAVRIVGDTVAILAGHTRRLAQMIGGDSIPVAVYGGMFEHNLDFFQQYCAAVQAACPNCQISSLSVSPCIGAVLYGLHAKKIAGEKEIAHRILSENKRRKDLL